MELRAPHCTETVYETVYLSGTAATWTVLDFSPSWKKHMKIAIRLGLRREECPRVAKRGAPTECVHTLRCRVDLLCSTALLDSFPTHTYIYKLTNKRSTTHTTGGKSPSRLELLAKRQWQSSGAIGFVPSTRVQG